MINPYSDDPTDHLLFLGPVIHEKLGDLRGERTVDRLKLHSVPLVVERAKRIEFIRRLISRWAKSEGADKSTAADIVRDELSDDREFVQTLREYARGMGFPVDEEVA